MERVFKVTHAGSIPAVLLTINPLNLNTMKTIVTIQGNYAYLVKGNETTQVVISEYVNGGAKHLTTEQIEALAEAGVTKVN